MKWVDEVELIEGLVMVRVSVLYWWWMVDRLCIFSRYQFCRFLAPSTTSAFFSKFLLLLRYQLLVGLFSE